MDLVHNLLRQSRVLDLGPLPAPRLGPEATLQQGLQLLVRGRRGAVVIEEDRQPLGILTERDLVYRMNDAGIADRKVRERIAVAEIMSQPAVTVRQQASLLAAIDTMRHRGLRHLVVVDRDTLVKGLLTTNDLVQFLTDQFPEDIVNLPPRLHQQYKTSEGA